MGSHQDLLCLFCIYSLVVHVTIVGSKVDSRGEENIDRVRKDGMSANNKVVTEQHLAPLPRDKNSAVPEEFYTAKRNCNPHNYNFIINQPTLCTDHKEVLLLVFIRSIFSHYDRRMAMRETWAMQETFNNYTVKFAFLFAAQPDSQIQTAIIRESQIYDDIIQEDFEESYGNLTLKTVMAWKWAKIYCPHAYYVMVGDDSIVVDIHKLVNYLLSQLPSNLYTSHVMLCYLFPCCTRAIHSRSKYAVSDKVYSGSAYPAYCSGTGYVATIALIEKLYLMSLDTPSFMPDDAWMGVIAEKLGIKLTDTYTSYIGISTRDTVLPKFLHPSYPNSPLMVGILDYHYAGKESTMIRSVWRIITEHQGRSKRLLKGPMAEGLTESPDTESNNVWRFAVLLMSVDMAVIVFVFFMVFYRKRRSK